MGTSECRQTVSSQRDVWDHEEHIRHSCHNTIGQYRRQGRDPVRRWFRERRPQLVREGIAETLIYFSFPDAHWRRIRTNNPLERIMREIRRRAPVVGAFPDGHSALMPRDAPLRHIAGTKWGTRRYLDVEPLLKQQRLEDGA